jgi:antitoxin HicB
MRYAYIAEFEPDPDGGFAVTFPDIPEAITGGESVEEARANAADALGMALRGYLAHGQPLPRPTAEAGENGYEIAVDVTDALKLATIEAFNASGFSKSELARRLGKADNEAHRILDPDHHTKPAALEAALAILGKTVVISVRDAA